LIRLGYALAVWRALTRYLGEGGVDVDNSATESALLRTLDRKNYRFDEFNSGG
jgi:hypothetical protein